MQYMMGLARCNADRGFFFVPNSLGEFTDVMANVPDTSQHYFGGLQNWVKRGAGTTRETWNVATGYTTDTDEIWSWMDRDSMPLNISSSNFIPAVLNSINVNVHKDKPFISWQNIPSVIDLIINFVYNNTNWEIDPIDNLGIQKRYICEISNACASCPSGYYRFDQYCFQRFNKTSIFDNAVMACPVMGGTLFSPRTENLAVYSRALSAMIGEFWIGLSRTNYSSAWKWDDNGQVITGSDTFDVHTSYPTTGHTAFFQQQSVPTGLSTVRDTNVDWNGSGGWKSGDRISMTKQFLCQIHSPITTTSTSTSTTTSTTTTPTTTTTTTPTTTTTTPTTTTTTTTPTTTTTTPATVKVLVQAPLLIKEQSATIRQQFISVLEERILSV